MPVGSCCARGGPGAGPRLARRRRPFATATLAAVQRYLEAAVHGSSAPLGADKHPRHSAPPGSSRGRHRRQDRRALAPGRQRSRTPQRTGPASPSSSRRAGGARRPHRRSTSDGKRRRGGRWRGAGTRWVRDRARPAGDRQRRYEFKGAVVSLLIAISQFSPNWSPVARLLWVRGA